MFQKDLVCQGTFFGTIFGTACRLHRFPQTFKLTTFTFWISNMPFREMNLVKILFQIAVITIAEVRLKIQSFGWWYICKCEFVVSCIAKRFKYPSCVQVWGFALGFFLPICKHFVNHPMMKPKCRIYILCISSWRYVIVLNTEGRIVFQKIFNLPITISICSMYSCPNFSFLKPYF